MDTEPDEVSDTHRQHLNRFYAACTALTISPADVSKNAYDRGRARNLNNNCYFKKLEFSSVCVKEEPQPSELCRPTEKDFSQQNYCENTIKEEPHDTNDSITVEETPLVDIKSEEETIPGENKTLYASLKSLLDQLSKSEAKELGYICYYCNRSFRRKKYLRKHIIRCQRSNSVLQLPGVSKRKAYQIHKWKFNCKKCDRKFPQNASLQRHLYSKACTTSCKVCGYIPRKPCELKRHMVKHTGERIICPHCDKKFTRSYALTKHLTEHKLSHYPCTKCELKFISLKHLQTHSKKAHTHKEHKAHKGENEVHPGSYRKSKFFCTYCKIYFEIEVNYSQHMKKHSSTDFNAKPYSCTVCHKRFVKRFSLRNHAANCVNRKASRGEAREVNFVQNDNMNYYFCRICDNYFHSALQFQRHRSTHSIAEIKPFGCAHCEKRFTQRYSLINHLTKCSITI